MSSEQSVKKPLLMAEYQSRAARTDNMPKDSLETPILGLFGEVGSLLSALKKKRRERVAFAGYDAAILEELGDTLWYFVTVASRAKLELPILAQKTRHHLGNWAEVRSESGLTFEHFQVSLGAHDEEAFGRKLVELAGHLGNLVNDFRAGEFDRNGDLLSGDLVKVLAAVVAAADAGGVSLTLAAEKNLQKIASRWPESHSYPPLIDDNQGLPDHEKLIRNFELSFTEVTQGQKVYVYQTCNGINIGDRLTDNKTEKDDYRFHDVFHIAFAVHLGWSPVLRALFKVKRKSRADLDENQDGARAMLIEEGVSTFIFGYGWERGNLAGADSVEYGLLKSIQDFVKGYEVEKAALWQWERAILDAFKVFRELREHRRGVVVVDLVAHTMEFREASS